MYDKLDKVYQFKLGNPFYIRDIDRLFYACSFINSGKSFLMEKEKFDVMLNKGFITMHKEVSSF